jgi:subtilase family serine protease
MLSRARITGRAWFAVVAAAAAALTLAATVPAAASGPASGAVAAGQVSFRRACPAPARHQMACLALIDTTAAGKPLTRAQATTAGVHPYMAADLQAAYKLPSALLGERQTIAIVDAYDDPNAEADLAVYRQANNLPACTTGNGCFEKVNQQGQQCTLQGSCPPPGAGTGWPVEESLDLDMASALCPNCRILLVEANDPDVTADNLETAENTAATLGANVISNSWGSAEYTGELADCNTYFSHPGVAITVASGDTGFGATYPAACNTVTAVGGTTLYQDTSARGWGETAWSYDAISGEGTASGCSAYIPKPAGQHDRLCAMRTVGDTAAVADPDTPVALYDSYDGVGGWIAAGGTSVAAPLIAAVYALAGNTSSIGAGAAYLDAHHKDLYDITSGSDGSCGGSYLCTAVKGYDGPTGWGTPDGIGAF